MNLRRDDEGDEGEHDLCVPFMRVTIHKLHE